MKKNIILLLTLLSICISQSVAQIIYFSATDCGIPLNPMALNLDGTSDGRNLYRESPGNIYGYIVEHTSTNGGQWEIRLGSSILFWKTSNSTPNPPEGISGWNILMCPFGILTEFSISGVLPIEILNFNVKNESGKNTLTWKTVTEFNNKSFDIERSTDGKIFINLAQIKAENKPYSYQFVDNYPFNTTYYRLKQIDFDATETYSKVVSIAKERTKGLQIYPTLVSNGELNIIYVEDRQSEEFIVVNFLGQQVLSGKTTNQIDISGLAKGTYILKVGTEVEKFIKL